MPPKEKTEDLGYNDDWASHERARIIAELRSARGDTEIGRIVDEYSRISERGAGGEGEQDDSHRRSNGVYYTQYKLAKLIVAESIRSSASTEGTFLEPCVGGGAFLFAWIEAVLAKTKPSLEQIQGVLERCFIADNDLNALQRLLDLVPSFLLARFGIEVEFPPGNVHWGSSLFQESAQQTELVDLKSIFHQPQGFDFVITNPPYLLLKKDKRHGHTMRTAIEKISAQLKDSGSFRFVEGMPNLYKLFTEIIIDHWVAPGGVVGLLVPRSILTDSSTTKLRKHLLAELEIGPILQLPEGNQAFKTVGQAFCAFAARKGMPTRSVVFADIHRFGRKFVPSSKISLSTYERLSAGGGLFDFDESELHFLEILSEFPIIRDNSEIVNLRGELDMTLDFHFITDRDSGLPLIQGSNIGRFGLKAPSRFVSPDFLSRPKGKWVQKPRIACQQISNANQEVRMKWSYIAPGFVLANSCNFLALDDAMLRISGIGGDDFLNYLLGILNSEVMNARFKLTSANNHVSNSEIGSLPIGNPNPLSGSKISKLAAEMVVSHHSRAQAELDSMVVQNFGLVEAPPRRESRQ